jgi:HEXXH motif-containing protein
MPPTPLQLTDLTLPRNNTETVRTVLNSYFREAVRAFTQFPLTGLGPEARELYERTVAHVRRVLLGHPGLIVSVLRRPTHSALLWSALSRLDVDATAADRWMIELCLLIHFELAVQGGDLSDSLAFLKPEDGWWPALRSTSANLDIQLSPEVDHIEFGSGVMHVHQQGRIVDVPLRGQGELPADISGTIERPYHRIVDGISLALADNNPLCMDEAHPNKSGNALDLGGHPAEEWIATLRESFKLVDQYLPLIGEEMRLLLRLIIPVGYHDQKHLSASYQEAVGTIYMTLHPSLMTMTEALIHEFQHNKINAAFHLDPMLHNAFSPLYTSPVRPDPRPLHGIVLAVHAFQPIAKLYEHMTDAEHPASKSESFQRRFRDIIRMNRAGSQTVLTHAQPTPMGLKLFEEMRALEREQLRYEETHWSAPAAAPAPALPE